MPLALRPGARVVATAAGGCEVVLGREACALPGSSAVLRALDAWTKGAGSPAGDPDVRRAEAALRTRGWLIPARMLRSLPPPADPGHAALAADLVVYGDRAEHARRLRAAHAVRLVAEPPWRAGLQSLLGSGGVTVDRRASTEVHVGPGEPDRETAERLVAQGTTHLWVTLRSTSVEIGPFVDPGRTGCLLCVDAARCEADPGHAVRARQLGRATRSDEPLLPALTAIALGWAAQDLRRWAGGETPATWSATVTIGTDLIPERRVWLRHPHCGCAWDEL